MNIINAYEPCDASGKREVWRLLEDRMKGKENEKWCICGDFNTIRKEWEGLGKAKVQRIWELRDFDELIRKLG